ncbi:hypothetical protein NUU61_002914 [Penicillium alfredii]|uniref:Uncharacterized protein n=1 Tax=Penicillium alfredii TaxID=1506179 RepID=A0A9W9FSJ7_9EURO|nr:uncharacterized protein NUU61_002914 [Penicillium alfredii]KAJ5105567.1 hypothetical protein NUU61_002914 [Penicillium alfredii]
MARPHDLDPTHIPAFVKPLAPYVKPRQEALRIRQALTAYLRSFIVFADDANQSNHLAQSHLALCAPTDAVVDVKRFPADLPGIRKEYLKALQANVAARKNLRTVSQNVASLRQERVSRTRPSNEDSPQEPGADLRGYLLLLRDRRRHTKLQVFQHYLEDIKTQDGVDEAAIGTGEDLSQELLPDDPKADGSDRNGTGGLEELVHQLERAVVRARTQLDREKQLFEQVKTRHDSRTTPAGNEVPPAVKVQALQRTRDELVQWVEERLVSEGDPEESLLQDLPSEGIEEAQRLLEECKSQIQEQYTAYLQARRELLDAASRACQPVTVTTKPSTRSTHQPELLTEEAPPPNPLDVLSYTSETLMPLSKSHKALALQKSYLAGLLAKEKSTTLRVLNRLSDESHLLPEYPLLARQPRFKHAVAALNTRQQTEQPDQNRADEVVALADAWAFASGVAAANERDYVQQKVTLGVEVAHDARKTLGEIYSTLYQDLEEAMQENAGQQQEVSDIWASEARSTRPRKPSGSRTERRPKGPWSGLNAKVGVGE